MKIIAKNSRARFDYELGESFMAGIVLTGNEVKSIKNSGVSLKGSFVSFRGLEAYLCNASINEYKFATTVDYQPRKERKLLLQKKELTRLQDAMQSQAMTVVPTVIGLSRGLVKLEIALARGKKNHDKRQTKKKVDMLRDAARDTKNKI